MDVRSWVLPSHHSLCFPKLSCSTLNLAPLRDNLKTVIKNVLLKHVLSVCWNVCAIFSGRTNNLISMQVPMLPSFDKKKKTERSFICSHYIIDRNFSMLSDFIFQREKKRQGQTTL